MENFLRLELKQAVEHDSEFVFRVRREAFRDCVEEAIGWDEVFQWKTHLKRFGEQDFFLISWEDEPVGYVSFEMNEGVLDLYQVFVLPEYQGKGIGTWVVRNLGEKVSSIELKGT